MDKDVVNSFSDILKERVSSPVYGTFLFSFLFWNWKLIYLSFWVSEETIGISKLDYLTQQMIQNGFTELSFIPLFMHPFFSWFNIVVIPIIITYFMLRYFPHIQNWAYRENLDFKKERRKNLNQHNLDIEMHHLEIRENIARKEVLVQKEEKKATEQKIEKLNKKDLLEKDRYSDDYNEFKKLRFYNTVSIINDVIYNQGGYSGDLDSKILSYWHTNDLVLFRKDNSNFIELTDKGKYFLKKSLSENNAV